MQEPTDVKAGQGQPGSPIDERGYPSWPGIPVLLASIAVYVVGVLLVRGSGATRVWTAVALFVLGGLGFAGLDLLIVAAWGAAGFLIALRKFSWLPLGR